MKSLISRVSPFYIELRNLVQKNLTQRMVLTIEIEIVLMKRVSSTGSF